ncbi:transcriptional regulator [Opitutaceae bacterium TAV1]|nr:transcriptional regulator [Opitutaceae bacterium TAV1]
MSPISTQSDPSGSKLESVYRILEDKILGGAWALGTTIPSEMELTEEFGCSRTTIGKAVARLAHEGLVERRKRAGTRVIKNTIQRQDVAAPVELDAFAFIYPSEKHEGIWRTVKGFQDASQEAGRRVVLLSSGADFRKEIEFVSRLSEFDVRGAVVYPLLLSSEEQVRFSQALLDVKFPVVLAEVNLLGLEKPSVILDGYHAGYTMTRHLLERGAKRIGFFANYARVPSVRDRYLGYRAALEEAGLPVRDEHVMLETAMNPDFKDPLAESAHLAARYLDRCGTGDASSTVDGVVCVNDFLARGLARVAAARRIAIPKKLKITGMEDLALATTDGDLSLTTYRVPFEKTGATAFAVLTRLLKDGPAAVPLENQVRGELMARKSS